MLAHSANWLGKEHTLLDHSRSVAELAGEFASKFNAREYASMVALLHDLGKATPQFQARLHGSGEKTQHANVGALEFYQGMQDPVASVVVNGHHSGLCNISQIPSKVQMQDAQGKLETARGFLDSISLSRVSLPAWVTENNNDLDVEFFTRMIFSTLTDADYLDTESHFNQSKPKMRGNYPDISELLELFNQWYAENIKPNDRKINMVRSEIYQRCVQASKRDKGFHGLTVGTGMGKTLSGMAFALNHAKEHAQDGIVIVLPFLSIIDQNAQIYKEIFGEENVIEHHSGIEIDPNSRMKLATENWDAPIIITTLVQFLETLFSNRPGTCRKFHNISNRTIFMDEIQAIPVDLLDPTMQALGQLLRHYSCSFLFSTATPFAYDYLGIEVNEIAGGIKRFHRVQHHDRTDIHTYNDVIELIDTMNDSVLCIVNSKKDAYNIYKSVNHDNKYHLSTNMHSEHRKRIIQQIRNNLDNGVECIVVSTQLIEAGVDIDFPNLIRDIAPLESICQASGRCNREGKHDHGNVFLVDLKEANKPMGQYLRGSGVASKYIQQGVDLEDPVMIQKYFTELFKDSNNLDKKHILDNQRSMRFQYVNDEYRLINQLQIPIIMANFVDEPLMALESGVANRAHMREIQKYTINVTPSGLKALSESGGLAPVNETDMYVWTGKYCEKTGLSRAIFDGEVFDDEFFIV